MFHTKDHTKLINSSPYSQVLHAYSHTSCIFKINNQPQTNFGEQNTKPTLSSLRLEAFTQATGTVSLKLGSLAWASALQWHFASSRLGETFSPERGHPSLKQKSLAWAMTRVENTGFPTSSRLSEMVCHSKQGLSAWARCSSRTRVSSCYSCLSETSSFGQEYQFSSLFHACKARDSSKTANNAYLFHHKHHTITKMQNKTNPSFPYLEKASRTLRHLSKWAWQLRK